MRGIPADQVTKQHLDLLIEDAVPEGRKLEYKATFTAGPRGRSTLEDHPDTPSANPLTDSGKEALLEEIVAFANADGGTVIVGMRETLARPPRAAGLVLHQNVAGLERTIRDCLVAMIEPRLPYTAVRGMPLQDDGSGVILIEVGASAIGPHWVSRTRRATRRREDRCDPLSMTEIHEMVLRNARRFDVIEKRLVTARFQFRQFFIEHVRVALPPHLRSVAEHEYAGALEAEGKAALGMRVSIAPHQAFSVGRLEKLDPYAPSSEYIARLDGDAEHQLPSFARFDVSPHRMRRVLGGLAVTKKEDSPWLRRHVFRDGNIDLEWTICETAVRVNAILELIASTLAYGLGLYDNIRRAADAAAVPAELELSLLTRGAVRTLGPGRHTEPGRFPLPDEQHYPCYSVGDPAEFSAMINGIIADVVNAGGDAASSSPRFRYKVANAG